MFYRERSVSNPLNNPTIQPLEWTNNFFQKPTPTRFGALYVSTNNLVVEPGDQRFDNLVRVRLTNIQTFVAPGTPGGVFRSPHLICS